MLSLEFILLTVIVAALLWAGARRVSGNAISDPSRRSAFMLKFTLVLLGWLAYIAITSKLGVFETVSLPPRIPLLLVFPAFAFIAFFFVSGRFNNIIEHVPARWPIYFQSFRIAVELLLLQSFLEGLIPKEATFEGYNFDILIGLTAPFIGAIAFRKDQVNAMLVKLYNIAGFCTLAVVVFVFISQAYFPQLWHLQPTGKAIAIGVFPYTFLAGFLMPVAVFMHVLSLVKLKAVKNALRVASL